MILKYTCIKYLSAIFFSIHILVLRFFSAHQKPPCCCVFRRTNPILPRTTSPYCQQRQFKANLVDFLFKGHVINNFQTKQAAYDAGLDVASATRIVMGWVRSAKIWVVYEIRVLEVPWLAYTYKWVFKLHHQFLSRVAAPRKIPLYIFSSSI